MEFEITVDLSEVYKFLNRVEGFLHGNKPHLMEALGKRLTYEFRKYVHQGGTGGKMGPVEIAGGQPRGFMAQWSRTHPKWVRLRGKGHDKPLQHTGRFLSSFKSQIVSGTEVRVGSRHPGSRRFHFGDRYFGRTWSWSAMVAGGQIVRGTERGGGTRGAEGFRTFRPWIQARPWLMIWQSDVDQWWVNDVKRDLRISGTVPLMGGV